MIAAGMGPRPGEIETVPDALDALNDARMWLKAITQYETILAQGTDVSPDEFSDRAIADCLSLISQGIEAEIAEAQDVLARAQGRDIETEAEALAVIGGVIGRE